MTLLPRFRALFLPQSRRNEEHSLEEHNTSAGGTRVITELEDELVLRAREQLALRAPTHETAEPMTIVGAFVRSPQPDIAHWLPTFQPIALRRRDEALTLLRRLGDAIERGDARFDARHRVFQHHSTNQPKIDQQKEAVHA